MGPTPSVQSVPACGLLRDARARIECIIYARMFSYHVLYFNFMFELFSFPFLRISHPSSPSPPTRQQTPQSRFWRSWTAGPCWQGCQSRATGYVGLRVEVYGLLDPQFYQICQTFDTHLVNIWPNYCRILDTSSFEFENILILERCKSAYNVAKVHTS